MSFLKYRIFNYYGLRGFEVVFVGVVLGVALAGTVLAGFVVLFTGLATTVPAGFAVPEGVALAGKLLFVLIVPAGVPVVEVLAGFAVAGLAVPDGVAEAGLAVPDGVAEAGKLLAGFTILLGVVAGLIAPVPGLAGAGAAGFGLPASGNFGASFET